MFKALKSFCGKVSMKKGETKDLDDENLIKDLINSGFIEEIKDEIKKVDTEIKNEAEKIEEKIKKEVKKTKTSKNKK